MKVPFPRACALLVLLAFTGPAVAQVLLPPADIPSAPKPRRQQVAPRPIEPDPQLEPGMLDEPDEAPQPPSQQPMRPSRGDWNRPVERQELPPPSGAVLPPPAGPQQALPPAPGQIPAAPRQQAVQPNAAPGTASAPGIQTQTPPSPAGTVPPGSEDFVVVAPPPQRIENRTATFNGLDKITGRIIVFDAAIGETVQFGALQVTPRACYTRPPNETPNTTGFLEVDEITLQGDTRRLFTGWMFAASPGLHAVEHAIYDIWLVDCKQTPPSLETQTRR